MNWQDIIFSTGGAFFAISLWPVASNPLAKIPRTTSVPTTLFIGLFAITHATLGLYWACATECCSAAMWAWVAWRRSM